MAFTSSDSKVRFSNGDVLVTDASDKIIAAGLTKAATLRGAFDRGAQIYSLPGLHAKVLCLGRFAVVGSANLSSTSVSSLVEAALVTDHPGIFSDARALVARLQKSSTKVDEAFLMRIERIPVNARRSGTDRPRLSKPPKGRNAWLVGVHRLDEEQFPGEAARAMRGEAKATGKLDDPEASTSWIRFTGQSKFRQQAKEHDPVIQVWRASASSRTSRVYYSSPIVLRQVEPTCTRFYLADFEDDDDRSVSFSEFERIWRAAGGKGRLTPRVTRHIPGEVYERVVALWPTMG